MSVALHAFSAVPHSMFLKRLTDICARIVFGYSEYIYRQIPFLTLKVKSVCRLAAFAKGILLMTEKG